MVIYIDGGDCLRKQIFVFQTDKVDSSGWVSLSFSFFPPVITMKKIEVRTINLSLGFHRDSPRITARE